MKKYTHLFLALSCIASSNMFAIPINVFVNLPNQHGKWQLNNQQAVRDLKISLCNEWQYGAWQTGEIELSCNGTVLDGRHYNDTLEQAGILNNAQLTLRHNPHRSVDEKAYDILKLNNMNFAQWLNLQVTKRPNALDHLSAVAPEDLLFKAYLEKHGINAIKGEIESIKDALLLNRQLQEFQDTITRTLHSFPEDQEIVAFWQNASTLFTQAVEEWCYEEAQWASQGPEYLNPATVSFWNTLFAGMGHEGFEKDIEIVSGMDDIIFKKLFFVTRNDQELANLEASFMTIPADNNFNEWYNEFEQGLKRIERNAVADASELYPFFKEVCQAVRARFDAHIDMLIRSITHHCTILQYAQIDSDPDHRKRRQEIDLVVLSNDEKMHCKAMHIAPKICQNYFAALSDDDLATIKKACNINIERLESGYDPDGYFYWTLLQHYVDAEITKRNPQKDPAPDNPNQRNPQSNPHDPQSSPSWWRSASMSTKSCIGAGIAVGSYCAYRAYQWLKKPTSSTNIEPSIEQ